MSRERSLPAATGPPGFVAWADERFAKGVARVACIAINDAFAMEACDSNVDFTRAIGLQTDGSQFRLGTRCTRFPAIIDDGTVTYLDVDETGAVDASACGGRARTAEPAHLASLGQVRTRRLDALTASARAAPHLVEALQPARPPPRCVDTVEDLPASSPASPYVR